MAGFIELSDSQTWSSSNWVYWGLMDHLINALSSEPAISNHVEGCKWAQSLSFPLLCEESAAMANQIKGVLEVVATRIVRGELQCEVDGREVDQSSQQQFREEISRLVDMVREHQIPPA